ncbi:uncharacterized protein CBL_09976 [Carabus blaptoides fortunei]
MMEYDNLDASENLYARGIRDEIPKQNSGKLLKKNVGQEVIGNLFDAPSDCSLVQCLAQDLRMGRRIAVRFKKIFGLDINEEKQNFNAKTVPHKYNEVTSPIFNVDENGVVVEIQVKEGYNQETSGNQETTGN